ncbi:Transcription factor [Komagataella phaffii CBS 7435]|uniref:Transcription factor (BHLH) involved in interorganelle communication n=2 Tax=Komagataella phaffii TaxID=460519 RepID=C4QWX5_KOMPG|nr:multi-metabolic pathway regulator RTG1 [Komagataella phaffii GS115]AOA61117.1 GQ67_02956T0 [Komagataella phaffii]CAH2446542.1 Transcription factor [Komagataella phaffii CBS 7435]AOA65868.1 GQ68_02291T0 [Komagataella phaffii GS115]CAY67748.1 Transcription factor (bHLH) involved in interorganelle communication [Komagataella phaffii GS115]CCA36835.1 Transcription factor [Komagataella phaffii CBS 7435]
MDSNQWPKAERPFQENEILDFSSLDNILDTDTEFGRSTSKHVQHTDPPLQQDQLLTYNIDQASQNTPSPNFYPSSIDVKQSLSKALPASHNVKSESPQQAEYNSNEDSNNQSESNINTAKSRRSSVVTTPGGTIVERKRRDNINERIQDLLTVIPESFFLDPKDKAKATGTKDGKPNKGQILTKAVEYIHCLQQDIDDRNRQEVALSLKLKNLEIAHNVPEERREDLKNTSAEKGLGSIGVGPLAD